ncbi:antitoxin VapB family protein [Salinirussus salinus]|jgi:predicted CopG family antitoxin|uniref:antitoxin VapB family protein n=1 Tax=Salinirussus salinus TaxID=1198300 RepID=UPI001356DBD6|nr:antitoxin VapB family protein [Salinirussus salinus]
MSKNISISDEVYRKLKQEKGDRSFSEVIEDRIESGGTLADVAGQGIFDADTYERMKDDIGELSEGTVERVEDETR